MLSKKDKRVGTIITAILVLIFIVLGVVGCRWYNSDCEARGGHLEYISTDNGGWVCEGAERGWFSN